MATAKASVDDGNFDGSKGAVKGHGILDNGCSSQTGRDGNSYRCHRKGDPDKDALANPFNRFGILLWIDATERFPWKGDNYAAPFRRFIGRNGPSPFPVNSQSRLTLHINANLAWRCVGMIDARDPSYLL
jgi:hypothetical protein